MNRESILTKLEENRETIRGFGVRRLGIFGSFARGEQSGASAIDFVVEFARATFDNYFDLKFFLEDLFGRTVDLVELETFWSAIEEGLPGLEQQTKALLGEES